MDARGSRDVLQEASDVSDLRYEDVVGAQRRLRDWLPRTPLLRSDTLDEHVGHRVVFKAECFQKVGAFKSRGALNA